MPYVVTSAIHHLGKDYAAGDAIELHPAFVHQLVAAGCVKEVPPPLPVQEKPVSTVGGQASPVDKPATKPIQPAAPRGRLSLGD